MPLLHASRKGAAAKVAATKLLLEAGADVNHKGDHTPPVLHYAVIAVLREPTKGGGKSRSGS